MGDMADYIRQRDFEDMMDGPEYLAAVTPVFLWWIQKDGTRIHIRYMTDSHIMNCINMIDRRDNWRVAWIDPLMRELEKSEKLG